MEIIYEYIINEESIMDKLCVISVYFNPAKYKALLENYLYFSSQIKKQQIKLITVECAFDGDPFQIPKEEGVYQLRSNSVMWQKERLINYGISRLPDDCDYFAWIDGDIILPDNWQDIAIQELQKSDIIQLYKKVYHLPKGLKNHDGSKVPFLQSVLWQKLIHKNWLQRRKAKELSFSTPGFAWAAKRDLFQNLNIYDKNIVGSGDTFIVDCLLDSWDIHGFAQKFTPAMKEHMLDYCNLLRKRNPKIGYLPIDICHLYHGSLKNRSYMDRHQAILDNNYDPMNDIALVNDVYEWASNKTSMHESIKNYFFSRLEDDE
jgi:hypothetical protein